ncbi:hypothetical protein QJQ45_008921 [Haematococcus lacustris]|nr:hypothetical protein QJQ45_008921 [Haematococcus lacustris]
MATRSRIRFYDRDVSAALNIRRIATGPGRPRDLSSWLGRPALPILGRPGQEWVLVRDRCLCFSHSGSFGCVSYVKKASNRIVRLRDRTGRAEMFHRVLVKADWRLESATPDGLEPRKGTMRASTLTSHHPVSSSSLTQRGGGPAMRGSFDPLAHTRHKDSLEIDMQALQARGTISHQPGGKEQPPSRAAAPSPLDTSWKYLVALCAISVVICYADRSNISTAVLPMAEHFGWDKAFTGIVLSSFFGGYALTQVLGGQLADKLGGKVVLAAGVSLWSLLTAATPAAAAAGVVPLLAARVLLGVGEGVAFPSIHSLIARNVPQQSQSTAVGVVTAASYAGTALAFGVSPVIISQLGWQWVFYLFAGLALVWLPFWLPIGTADNARWGWLKQSSTKADAALPGEGEALLAPHSPASLPESGWAAKAATDSRLASERADQPRAAGVPPAARGFWALMQRREVWAICVAQYCQSWGMYGLLNWLPTFFKDFYQVEISDLGAYTLAPYVVQGGLGLVSGLIADGLLNRGWGVRRVRTLLQVVGMLGPAVCLMLAVSPAVGASPTFASQLITVGLGFSALTLGGVSVSHLDVAPRHAGVVFGAGNTAATLAGLLSVPCTGYLLQATNSWPLVFGITAGHYVVGAGLWALWMGDRQLPEDKDDEEAKAQPLLST